MTISTTTNKTIAQGNGVTTAFNFSFQVRAASDLEVIYTDADGVSVTLLSSQYSVALNPAPGGQLWSTGGTVTYPLSGSAVASGASLTVLRNVPYLQSTSLINQGGFYPQSVEQALDVLTMEDQQINEQIGRAIVANVSDVSPVLTLPPAAVRASGLLGFDSSGNVEILSQSGGTPVFSNSPWAVPTLGTLKALSGMASSVMAEVAGYYTVGDGGGGLFYWNASDTTTDNGGTVIAPNAGGIGRWNRIVYGSILHAKWFGMKWDGVTDDTAYWAKLMLAANGFEVRIPGNVSLNSVVTAKLTLPKSIKIIGPTRRGIGNPPTATGAGIQAKFAGPLFEYAPGSLTSADILLEGFTVRGDKATYGAGNGITLTNCADVTLHSMVISNFGTDNVHVSGGNYVTLEDVYCATPTGANFYIDAPNCKIRNCSSDGGTYGIQGTANSTYLVVDGGSWFEGATIAGISAGGVSTSIDQTTCNQTAGGKGILAGAVRLKLGVGVHVIGEGTAASTIGIDLADKIECSVVGAISTGFQTGIKSTNGFLNVMGGQFEGIATGGEFTATGTGWQQLIGAVFAGPTNSVLHNSGNKAVYICQFDDGTGVYKAPTISAGSPLILSPNASDLVLRGTIDASAAGGLKLGGGGGTGVVSVGAVDSAAAGFRTVRIPN